VLHVERDPAIGITFEIWEHRRVNQVAIDRIRHKQLLRNVVHRQRPERFCRRKFALREVNRVTMRATERFAVTVFLIPNVDCFGR
jgi:hypothetical protein